MPPVKLKGIGFHYAIDAGNPASFFFAFRSAAFIKIQHQSKSNSCKTKKPTLITGSAFCLFLFRWESPFFLTRIRLSLDDLDGFGVA